MIEFAIFILMNLFISLVHSLATMKELKFSPEEKWDIKAAAFCKRWMALFAALSVAIIVVQLINCNGALDRCNPARPQWC